MKQTLTVLSGMIAVALAASSATPSQTTTSVYLPIIGSQTLVASLSGSSGETKTLIMQCPSSVSSGSCGFPTPVTVTAGPSTVALKTTVQNQLTLDLKCGIEGSTKATCAQTYVGPASLHSQVSNGQDGAKTETWTASTTLSGSQVIYCPVTITAEASKGAAAPTPPAAAAAKAIVVAAVIQQFAAALV